MIERVFPLKGHFFPFFRTLNSRSLPKYRFHLNHIWNWYTTPVRYHKTLKPQTNATTKWQGFGFVLVQDLVLFTTFGIDFSRPHLPDLMQLNYRYWCINLKNNKGHTVCTCRYHTADKDYIDCLKNRHQCDSYHEKKNAKNYRFTMSMSLYRGTVIGRI